MTNMWRSFAGDGILEIEFPITSSTETEDLAFLSCENIKQEHAAGLNDSESFVDVEGSTSSDSSEEGSNQVMRSEIKQLVKEVRVLRMTFITSDVILLK